MTARCGVPRPLAALVASAEGGPLAAALRPALRARGAAILVAPGAAAPESIAPERWRPFHARDVTGVRLAGVSLAELRAVASRVSRGAFDALRNDPPRGCAWALVCAPWHGALVFPVTLGGLDR